MGVEAMGAVGFVGVMWVEAGVAAERAAAAMEEAARL